MEKQNIYAKGLYFNKNHPDTSAEVKKWKKGSVSVHIENFVTQLESLKSYADEKGYIKFDLCENEKDGEKFLSFKLNTYKKEVPKPVSQPPEWDGEEIDPEDIPF
jgi:hypothetical protein